MRPPRHVSLALVAFAAAACRPALLPVGVSNDPPAPSHAPAPSALPSPPLLPGAYGSGLFVSYDRRRELVSGSYESATGWDEQTQAPRFTCRFYFVGHLPRSDRAADVDVWEVDLPQPGRLEVLSERQLRITLARKPGGCWNVDPDVHNHIDREGTVFWRDDETSEDEANAACTRLPLRRVRARRAPFFDAPGGLTRRDYVVKNDVVCVTSEQPGWLQTRYEKTRGWLRTDDLEPLF